MKKYLLTIMSLVLPVLTLANGDHTEGDTAISTQLQELLPFEHIEEGHWLAFALSVLLWISLIYTIYSLIQKISKPKTSI